MAFAVEHLGPERTQGMRLEEIESDPAVWYITLSMLSQDEPNPLAVLAGQRRDYKKFAVSKDTGEVTAMKNRELADA